MTGFVLGAVLTTALVLALLLRPFLFKQAAAQTSQRQLNTAIYRDQLAKLEQDLADGTLSREDHAPARAELQRRMLDDSVDDVAVAKLRVPRKTIAGIVLTVPLAAVAFYLLNGNPQAVDGGHAVQAPNQEEVVKMVESLARKLEKEPDNLQGWALLARSYKVMGRSPEAEIAFARAGNAIDNDAQMLANYADVAAENAGGRFAGKPAMLIDKALKADPENPMALWLAGTAALEARQYDKALRIWEHLMAQLPPGSEDAQMLQGAIADARSRGGKGAVASGNPVAVAAASVAPVGAAAPGASITGTVELDAALKAKIAATDTLIIIARPPGTRMPLAVLRVRADQLPMKFKLDDSLSMSPQALLSSAREVEVEARVSKTGMAKAEAGDLLSAVQVVKVGATGVALKIAQVRQ